MGGLCKFRLKWAFDFNLKNLKTASPIIEFKLEYLKSKIFWDGSLNWNKRWNLWE
jgi:hypothetical protein